jgi:hypothetical protein
MADNSLQKNSTAYRLPALMVLEAGYSSENEQHSPQVRHPEMVISVAQAGRHQDLRQHRPQTST